MRQVFGKVDIDFSAGEGQSDQGEGWLHEQDARALVATERAELCKDCTGKDGGRAHNARVSRS